MQKGVSRDDIEDVMQLMTKIEEFAAETLAEVPMELAMSALMSATTNCILSQCRHIDDLMHYMDVFKDVLNKGMQHFVENQ